MRVVGERGRAAPAPQATIFGQVHPLWGFAARRERSRDVWSVVTDSVRVSSGEAPGTPNALWISHIPRRTPGGGGPVRKLLPGVQAPRDLALRQPSCSAQPQERGDAIHLAHRRSSLRPSSGTAPLLTSPRALRHRSATLARMARSTHLLALSLVLAGTSAAAQAPFYDVAPLLPSLRGAARRTRARPPRASRCSARSCARSTPRSR